MGEVLVIGGGMAGAIAALSARRAGAAVTLVRRALGATALSSGAIDVAADPFPALGGDDGLSVLALAERMGRAYPDHPYAVLASKLGRLPEALSFAARSLEGLVTLPGERNLWLPTPLGTVKPSAMAQRGQAAGALSALPERVAVVDFAATALFDARAVAQGLESEARARGRSVTAVPVSSRFFRHLDDALRSPFELAEALDAEGSERALADHLRLDLPAGVQAVLLPPVLGWRRPGLSARLSDALGIPCAEVLSAAPSVPGVRLQDALDRALNDGGVRRLDAEVRGGEGGSVWLEPGGATRAGAVVLATGKYIGGGIARAPGFREPVFDLPVFVRGRRLTSEWLPSLLGDVPEARHDAFLAGIRVDAELRPLGPGGAPARERLFAAGSVIAGYDPAVDKSGLGVAIFTGYLAGEAAARAS